VVLGQEAQALAPYETWSGVPTGALGFDLENAQTVVSFGAPLLDGWASPGRFSRLWAQRAAGQPDPQLRLVQVEASLSRTAARAWQWVTIPAGTAAALAAGLARVLLEERPVSARGPMPPLTLAQAAEQTGLSTGAIHDLAKTIVARPPVVAIAANDNPAIAALNVVLGAVGTTGGIVQRSKQAASYVSADAVIPSVRAVLLDSTVPWDFVPQTDAEIFRFAGWDEGSTRADWLLPAPVFLEEVSDVPTAPASAIETYAIVPGLVKAPPEVASAAQFLGSMDSTLITVEKLIHARCGDLFHAGKGTLQGSEAVPLAKVASVEKFEEQLRDGAVWAGGPPNYGGLRCELKEWPATPYSPRPSAWPAGLIPVLPPLATKLCQESGLRKASKRGIV